jgi:hypothetical protein
LKGKGFPDIEDKLDWHGKAFGNDADKIIEHVRTSIKNPDIVLSPTRPTGMEP